MRQCEVYVHGIRAGVLTEDDHREYTFSYDAAYLSGEENPPVSLTLPLRKEPYHSPYLFAFFFNMLSEGENRQIQSQVHHIDADDDFGILLATAQADTIGAVTIKPIAL
ncbi:HipA N-terminal domain-containing protein [Bacteroides stercorirosoris]|uniref:Serine/threonine-protein kinase HipA n=1 Tax=Bacteroides stercorirosoris TaxID=871324 RepID=A0A1M6M7R6_9BACE|nr:HipA N-terminal domain-containing protein [Bacteroides stercorirosoris]OKZ10793.1 MAG: phosphatidylinositol kinase [Bacteroides oleiciplenus]SHJ79522.1 serine/threonine-protein kinase HipA [Bacteroides stercorirosoris]